MRSTKSFQLLAGALLVACSSGRILGGDDPGLGGGATGAGGMPVSGGGGPAGIGQGEKFLPPSADAAPNDSAPVTLGHAPLRRLTKVQLDRTISDLFGLPVQVSGPLTADERPAAFVSNVSAITELVVEQHARVAQEAAKVAPLASLVTCDRSQVLPCAEQFIASFGRRVYRRPLEPMEIAEYRDLFASVEPTLGFDGAVRVVIETLLQSPHFIYHVEIGAARAAANGLVPLTSYEVASRLAYFSVGSMPDEELLAAAAAGLSVEQQMEQARRLMGRPEAARQLSSFHLQWLGADGLDSLQRDVHLFPLFNEALAREMLQEVESFVDGVIRTGDGKLSTLLTSATGYPRSGLFDLYGVAKPPSFTAGAPLALNPNERAGILTLPAILAATSHADQTSPVKRGLLVRRNILCGVVLPPPNDVNPELPKKGEGGLPETATAREVLKQHSTDARCNACHQLLDPIGFGLEAYDAIGRFRTTDGGRPIDASGEVVASDELSGPFTGARELASRFSDSREVGNCYSAQWLGFALGRSPFDSEQPSVGWLGQAFAASRFDVRELLLHLITTDAFRTVPAEFD